MNQQAVDAAAEAIGALDWWGIPPNNTEIAATALEAALPHIRADERRRIIAAIRNSTIGAPLYLEDDGTAHIASGPEMREILCAFIEERSTEET